MSWISKKKKIVLKANRLSNIFTLLFLMATMTPSSFADKKTEKILWKKVPDTTHVTLKQPEFIKATDGVKLAYYTFLPKGEPTSVVLLYHGGGAYISKVYQQIGWQLAKTDSIACYMADVRGHGHSGGPRGDAPSPKHVWQDIDDMVKLVKQKHPQANVFLAGHSAGGGLSLNYLSNFTQKSVDGVLLLAPYLGPNSGIFRADEYGKRKNKFVNGVRRLPFIVNWLSFGLLCGNSRAITFNYTDKQLAANPGLTKYYTVNMSLAGSVWDTKKCFENLSLPIALFIGAGDEVFNPKLSLQYLDYVQTPDHLVEKQLIPNERHLSILSVIHKNIIDVVQKWEKTLKGES